MLAGTFGGVFSSPVIAAMLLLELVKPEQQEFSQILISILVGATISFAISYPISGAAFLKVFDLPPYEYNDWHLFAGENYNSMLDAMH